MSTVSIHQGWSEGDFHEVFIAGLCPGVNNLILWSTFLACMGTHSLWAALIDQFISPCWYRRLWHVLPFITPLRLLEPSEGSYMLAQIILIQDCECGWGETGEKSASLAKGRERMHVFVCLHEGEYVYLCLSRSCWQPCDSWQQLGKQHNLHCGLLYVKGLMRGTLKCGHCVCVCALYSQITLIISSGRWVMLMIWMLVIMRFKKRNLNERRWLIVKW